MESDTSNEGLNSVTRSPKRTAIFLGVILLVSFLVILPILLNGIPFGNDLKQHYQFASSVDDAIRSGHIFPNWAQNENNGYGGVGLRFYPPISYYVLSFGNILLGNWYDASVFAFTFWMFLGGVGIFFWSREFFSERASLAAAIMYIFVPYHVVELYASFTYAEFAASGVLPFCFLFVTRICKYTKPLDVALFALSYSVLVLTHLPLTVIGSVGLAVFAITSSRMNIRKILSCGIAVSIGLVLSSFHWIRIATEMTWINHVNDAYSASGKGIYDFRSNFLLSFPYISGIDNDINSLWYLDLVIIATLLIVLPFGIIFCQNAKPTERKVFLPIFYIFGFSFLMMTKASQPIWEYASFLQKVQFPWRWFSIVSIISVMIVAAGFDFCLGAWNTPKRSISLLAFTCLAFCVVFTCSQVVRQTTQLDRTTFDDTLKGVGASTNYDCWLPNWAEANFSQKDEKVMAGSRSVDIVSWQRVEKNVTIDSGDPTDIRFAILYYPHWHAFVNGSEIEIRKSPDGTISLPIGNGKTTIALIFTEPDVVRLAATISKFAWAAILIALFFLVWKTSSKSKI